MKLRDFLIEGPVRSLRNSVLGSRFFADAAEMHIKQSLVLLKKSIESKEDIPVEELMAYLKEGLKELRQLKKLLKNRNV